MDVLIDGEIVLFGTVGGDWFDAGFTAMDVVNALAQIGRNTDVTVRINSGGGLTHEGLAIFSALDSHRGKVTVKIEGVAASAASLICMAGDSVIMHPGSYMMIHDPATWTSGNAAEHAKTLEALETVSAAMASIYAEKTGRKADDIRSEMREEIWLTPEQALEKGYADSVEKSAKAKAGKTKAQEPTAFDYRLYRHAPERMTALATSRSWSHATFKADMSASSRQKEKTMAEDKAADAAKIKADADKAAADKIVADKILADKALADKAAADKIAVDAAAAGTETVEQITARVRAEEVKRSSDIVAACSIAGKPTMAAAFIADGKSLSDVVASLQADKAKGGKEIVSRSQNANTDKPSDGSAGWDKAVQSVNSRMK